MTANDLWCFALAVAIAAASLLFTGYVRRVRARQALRSKRGPIVWTRGRGERRRKAIRIWMNRYGIDVLRALTLETKVIEAVNRYESEEGRRSRLSREDLRQKNDERGYSLGANDRVLRY